MPGRNDNVGKYRFGFNGKEKDDEIEGLGNSYDYGARIYDTRIGRWLSMDPVFKEQESPFTSFSNNPNLFVDENGKDTLVFHRSGENGKFGDALLYLVTFSIIKNGVETNIPTDKQYFFFDHASYHNNGYNSWQKDKDGTTFNDNINYPAFDLMSRHPEWGDAIRVVGGSFVHPAGGTGWLAGCYGIATEISLTDIEGSTLLFANPDNGKDALKDLRAIYNNANGGINGNNLTGAKWLFKVNSESITQVDPIPAKSIEYDTPSQDLATERKN